MRVGFKVAGPDVGGVCRTRDEAQRRPTPEPRFVAGANGRQLCPEPSVVIRPVAIGEPSQQCSLLDMHSLRPRTVRLSFVLLAPGFFCCQGRPGRGLSLTQHTTEMRSPQTWLDLDRADYRAKSLIVLSVL